MVAQKMVLTYGINQVFLFVEGIWLHQKSSLIRFFFARKRPISLYMCATRSELPSCISTMKTRIRNPA